TTGRGALCGVTADGALHCTGSNAYGALGNGRGGRSPFQSLPGDTTSVVLSPDGSGWRAVAAPRFTPLDPYGQVYPGFVCAITGNGALYCWGGVIVIQVAGEQCLPDSIDGRPCAVVPVPVPSPASSTARPLAR